LPIAAVFVAVLVLDANLHAPPRPIFIVGSIISVSVRAIPIPIVIPTAILVAIAKFVAVPAPHVLTKFSVAPARAVPVTPAHPPVGTYLAVIALRLTPVGSLISWLLRILVRWRGLSRHALRSRNRRLTFVLGEGGQARRGQQKAGKDKSAHGFSSGEVANSNF
jgi:prepilin signal peptidase PulO-like enzyme (type II secretory pathway)